MDNPSMSTKESNKYNFDYYERGLEAGVSCYYNYKWLPYKTIPTVMAYIDHLNIERGASVLDFGCAKGFYVKALRLLARDAWGCDISNYAISAADDETKRYVKVCDGEAPIPFNRCFDYIIAKDVLEHLEEEEVISLLQAAKKAVPKKFFIVVPLTKNGKYIIPSDELDATHKIRKTKQEWADFLTSSGWHLDFVSCRVEGIKDHHAIYPEGVGFFTLTLE